MRIRTVKPELCARFKKRAIPSATRKEVALNNGCENGGQVAAKCAHCSATGTITWFKSRNQFGGWVHFSGLEMDHIIPESKGGTGLPENIQLLCRRCNRRKGAK